MNQNRQTSTPVVAAFLDFFRRHGIRTIFCVPGAQIETLLVAFARESDIKVVVAAHEQGATAMADGYARISGSPGVVFTINGPGILNTVTMMNTARQDHIPVVIVSGDAPESVRGYGAFQESNPKTSDTLGILEKSCGWAVDVQNLEILTHALDRFSLLAKHDPHPMYLNLPMDVVLAAPHGPIDQINDPHPQNDEPLEIPRSGIGVLGIILSTERATTATLERVVRMAHLHRIPMAVSLSAKSWLDRIDPSLQLGLYGYAGHERAICALHDTAMTTLLAVGLRWDERNTLAWQLDSQKTIALDCELTSFHSFKASGASSPDTLDRMDEEWSKELSTSLAQREVHRNRWMNHSKIPASGIKSANFSELTCAGVIHQLNESLGSDSTLFVDSGDHRIYANTFFEATRQRQMITAAHTGPMGWAIGAAIGASFINQKETWIVTGDGCMLMSGNELAVAARYGCPVKVVVFDNGAYARVAIRLRNNPRHIAEDIASLPKVDWVAYGRSLGVNACHVDTMESLKMAIEKAHKFTGPFLIIARTPMEDPPYKNAIVSTASELWIRSHQREE